jgi:signal transduction histidine kinase
MLVLARVVWIMLAALSLAVLFTSLPAYMAQLQSVCAGATCAYGQLSPDSVQTLDDLGLSTGHYAIFSLVLVVASALVWFGVGVVIFWRTWGRSNDWFALLVALMLVLGSPGSTIRALGGSPWEWQWSARFVFFLGKILAALFLSLFPDGRFVPRWTRWLVVIWIPLMGFLSLFTDLPFSAKIGSPFLASLIVLVIGLILVFLGAQFYRYRYISGTVERQQIKWVVFGMAVGYLVTIVFALPVLLFPSQLADTGSLYFGAILVPVLSIFPLLVPLSIGIATLHYRLWDIDVLINRTLVYGTLTACVVALYVLVVGSLGVLLQIQGNLIVSLLATGLVAVLFHPLRNRLQRAVNRMMYGERDDPNAVLSRLGSRLEATLAPEAVLPTLVETVAQALKLPYVAIALKQEETFIIVASYGLPQHESLVLPLVYQTETTGQFLLASRAHNEPFSPVDRRLLEDIAHQAGVAAYAVRLTSDLQHSRERLVTTREEERRRLRRDLHDGLGPILAIQSLQLGAARELLAQNPAAADALLSELKAQTQAIIADIRRLVYDLRPPALDELGLLSALREHAAHYSQFNGLHITLEAPECLPPLPAAVEVAAYRIVLEAITNVVRHARASKCRIFLSLSDVLSLEILDDGVGLSEDHRAGVGMTSMRERAEELGGMCKVETGTAGGVGTRVCARLPLPKEELTDGTDSRPDR